MTEEHTKKSKNKNNFKFCDNAKMVPLVFAREVIGDKQT